MEREREREKESACGGSAKPTNGVASQPTGTPVIPLLQGLGLRVKVRVEVGLVGVESFRKLVGKNCETEAWGQ